MIQTMAAAVASFAKGSRDIRMMRTKQIASTMNRPSTMIAPIRPSSSPMIAKMKSLSASGTHDHFPVELPSPTPNRPP